MPLRAFGNGTAISLLANMLKGRGRAFPAQNHALGRTPDDGLRRAATDLPRQPDDVRSPGQSRHPAARPPLPLVTHLRHQGARYKLAFMTWKTITTRDYRPLTSIEAPDTD
jgi:hypothetical protein